MNWAIRAILIQSEIPLGINLPNDIASAVKGERSAWTLLTGHADAFQLYGELYDTQHS